MIIIFLYHAHVAALNSSVHLHTSAHIFTTQTRMALLLAFLHSYASQVLSKNKTLLELNFARNEISGKGIIAIASGLYMLI